MSQIPLPNVKGDVRNVKMWRKDDFDRLVEKAKKLGISGANGIAKFATCLCKAYWT